MKWAYRGGDTQLFTEGGGENHLQIKRRKGGDRLKFRRILKKIELSGFFGDFDSFKIIY